MVKPKLVANKNKITLTHTLGRNETYLASEKQNTYTLSIFKKPIWVLGYASLCEDLKHVLLLDYDNVCRRLVFHELERIYEEENLTPFYVFMSKENKIDGELIGNYHAVCLQKFYPNQVQQLQLKTHCDAAYITAPLKTQFRYWVLRAGTKHDRDIPKYIGTVGTIHEKNKNNPVSSAHLALMEKFKVLKFNYGNLDNYKKLYLETYKTLNY